jgi:lipopolysaccharide export system permease protein
MKLLNTHLIIRFLSIFTFCVLGVIIIFIVVDLVENVDRFVDMHVKWTLVILYYIFYTPYIVVLTLPMASLLTTSILIGGLARNNELVAMKSLGFSYYQVLAVLIFLGFCISLFSFGLAEGFVAPATRKRVEMEREYLKKHLDRDRSRYTDLKIQEPPNKLILIGDFNIKTETARNVTIETYRDLELVHRIDAPEMVYRNGDWWIGSGYQRYFHGLEENASAITDTLRLTFQFAPEDLIRVKLSPDEMSMFELYRFAMRIKNSGGEIHKWMTDLHLRVAFPMSNLFIIFLSLPLVYNRRKKSITAGVGLSLLICFLYFGLVKTGQTFGYKKELTPFMGAWMGNGIAFLAGLVGHYSVRK